MKKFRKVLILILIIVLILLIFSNKKKKQSNENGNISNMGLVVSDGNNVYYNKYEKGIFAVKNGKEEQLTDETAYSMNLVGDKIYYLTIADFSNVVIKSVDTNGENQKTIFNIYTSISKIFVNGDYIYYSTNKKENGIARIDLNGKNEVVVVSSNIQDFAVNGNEIFYVDDQNQIYKVSTSGKNNELLTDQVSLSKFQIVDDWIYYYNESENALFRLSKNGKKNELVSVLVKNEVYNVAGNYVYYLDEENSKIARMQIGKSNKCDDIVDVDISKTKINIAGNELYYLNKSSNESQTYQIYRVKINGDSAQEIDYN